MEPLLIRDDAAHRSNASKHSCFLLLFALELGLFSETIGLATIPVVLYVSSKQCSEENAIYRNSPGPVGQEQGDLHNYFMGQNMTNCAPRFTRKIELTLSDQRGGPGPVTYLSFYAAASAAYKYPYALTPFQLSAPLSSRIPLPSASPSQSLFRANQLSQTLITTVPPYHPSQP